MCLLSLCQIILRTGFSFIVQLQLLYQLRLTATSKPFLNNEHFARRNDMHSHEIKEHAPVRHLSHANSLFTGRGSSIYDVVMVRLTSNLYRRVIDDLALLRPAAGKVLDAGTGPGTLTRDIARHQPQLQVYGIDLSADMIQLARDHAEREQLAKRVHFDTGNLAHLPYPDQTFDLIVSTISMHHWYELEQPFRDLYRVLKSGGRLLIYDFRFMQAPTIARALASTPFAGTQLEQTLVRTGFWPFALYKRFALQKEAPLSSHGSEKEA
jgi:ubiquinone/menaquinone biosynthesis C-methylase UbiE